MLELLSNRAVQPVFEIWEASSPRWLSQQMTFGGQELYTTIEAKAAAICFSLVMNHAFVDGNKRIGHAAMETFLVLNGLELVAKVEESEKTILRLAAGELTREELLQWISMHIRHRDSDHQGTRGEAK